MTRRISNPTAKTVSKYTDAEVNDRFMVMLPKIRKNARWAFKDYRADRRAEAVQAIVVIAFELHHKLAVQGRLDESFPSPLSRFAIARYKDGRTGGAAACSTDVTSEHCKILGRSSVKNYGLAEGIADTFQTSSSAVDARYPVSDAIQFKIDFFEDWLPQQTQRDQEIILDLMVGETTNAVAEKYGVSASLISIKRRDFANSWKRFIDPPEAGMLVPA